MIDATYFRKQLSQDVKAAGDSAVVEVRLLNGQFHRVQTVSSVEDGYVILQAYELRSHDVAWKERWQEQVIDNKSPHELSRAIVPYESILDVVITRGHVGPQSRIGFGTVR